MRASALLEPYASRNQGPASHRGLAIISLEYDKALTPERLARHVNLSPSRLHSLFRIHAGTTPHAAITAKRMEKAAELLRDSHLLVKEVAIKVGLQNVSHFVRDFEHRYGLSPTRYRDAHYRPRS
jgi:AraC-like DNA-binding protein